jgi:hypothetical protein
MEEREGKREEGEERRGEERVRHAVLGAKAL